jgi:metal-responsive CopG/Arc/MetJ family transcriptional regulator
MARLNLTLDTDTIRQLDRHIKSSGKPRAALVRELLREGLARREALERRQQLARDYAAGRGDARTLLSDLESAQLELLDDEGA